MAAVSLCSEIPPCNKRVAICPVTRGSDITSDFWSTVPRSLVKRARRRAAGLLNWPRIRAMARGSADVGEAAAPSSRPDRARDAARAGMHPSRACHHSAWTRLVASRPVVGARVPAGLGADAPGEACGVGICKRAARDQRSMAISGISRSSRPTGSKAATAAAAGATQVGMNLRA